MDWGRFFMEWGWLGIAVPLLALVGTTIFSITQHNKGWKRVENKLGNAETGSLSRQHENMERNLKETITEKASNIYSKVDNIDKEMAFGKGRYESLSIEQKETKNHMDKLLFEWQNLVSENKELKKEVENLEEQNNVLLSQNNKLLDKMQVQGKKDDWDLEL